MQLATRRSTTLLLALGLSLLAPLLVGFLCFPLVPLPPSGVVTPTPAATFAPTVSAQVPAPTPGARSNIVAGLSFPAGSTLAIGAAFEIPAGWSVAADSGVTTGSIAGSVQGFMTVADPAFYSCATTVAFDPADIPPSDIKLIEATTNTATTVPGTDTNSNGKPDAVEDTNLNGLPDGVDRYPAFLNSVLPGTHKARYFGATEAAGLSDLYVNVIIDEIAPGGPYQVTTIVNDPTAPPESAAGQFCAPQSITLTLLGTSADNPATLAAEGGQALYTNPGTSGTYTFSAVLVSEFDLDNDRVSNGLDNCPATANTSQADADQDYMGDPCDASPGAANFDGDADGIENAYDNCIFTANASQADGDYDDIGDACDPNAAVPSGPNHYRTCTDAVGIGQADPGGATCGTFVPTPTPTPKDPNADTDGDTIPNGSDPDDDNDGCTDVKEQGSDPNQGGRRNPHYFWDFYDVWAHPGSDPNAWTRDRVISVPGDILGVAKRFGSARPGGAPSKSVALAEALATPTSNTGYHTDFDRGPVIGPNTWNLASPDGAISIPVDILGVARQFAHTCL